MIRAPDTYVYPAPFNLVETIFVAPLELVYQLSLTQLSDECIHRSFMSSSSYAKVQSRRGSIYVSNMDHSSTALS
jgi:hypothetical protein